MKRDIWGVFHDGVIRRIVGAVPGIVQLDIEISYLRKMFDGQGTSFQIRLADCTLLKYTEFGGQPTQDLQRIQDHSPELLYIELEHPLILDCSQGKMELDYSDIEIALDTGPVVTYESLVAATEKYWSDWSSRNKRGN